ncbi:MAG: recombinase, partial [Bacillota bacterium]|nr:recombinase [Bacillota bacterium]
MDRQIRALEREFPSFMKDYSIFLRGSVALSTHDAYFKDIKFFFEYLIEETDFTNANELSEITLNDLESLRARDINYFLGDYCRRYYKEDE